MVLEKAKRDTYFQRSKAKRDILSVKIKGYRQLYPSWRNHVQSQQ